VIPGNERFRHRAHTEPSVSAGHRGPASFPKSGAGAENEAVRKNQNPSSDMSVSIQNFN